MPTISLTQLAKIAVTLFIIALILPQIMGLISSVTNAINSSITNVTNSLGTVNGLDLGYVGRVTGLVDFLNNLMNSVVIASSLFMSAIISIVSIKFLIKFYTTATRI